MEVKRGGHQKRNVAQNPDIHQQLPEVHLPPTLAGKDLE